MQWRNYWSASEGCSTLGCRAEKTRWSYGELSLFQPPPLGPTLSLIYNGMGHYKVV
jgi:hypothetical protein